VKGDIGYMGFKGDNGLIGPKGGRGIQGYKGQPGNRPEPGDNGDAGPIGQTGIIGPMGPPGKKGNRGKKGPKGFGGKNGTPGPAGPPGVPGQPGPAFQAPWAGGHIGEGGNKGPGEDPAAAGGDGDGDNEGEKPPINPFYSIYRHYSSEKKAKPTPEILNKLNEKFRSRMDKIKILIDRMEKPDGSVDYPARTCRDLFAFHPALTSGFYWIDPNMGCKSDAIKVYCNITDTEIATCVTPSADMAVPKARWAKKMRTSAQKWFGEDLDLGQIEYKATESQLTFLGHLSKAAYQTVTYHCSNSIAWFDKTNANHKKSLKFRGMNKQTFDVKGPKRFQPKVVEDGCRTRAGQWMKSVFKFEARKFINLPIVDFATGDASGKESSFGLEVGPVCFV